MLTVIAIATFVLAPPTPLQEQGQGRPPKGTGNETVGNEIVETETAGKETAKTIEDPEISRTSPPCPLPMLQRC